MQFMFPGVYNIDGLGEEPNMGKTIYIIANLFGITTCTWLLLYLYLMNYNKCIVDT